MRPMVVAEQFYPGSRERLQAEVESLIPEGEKASFYRGAIMPHAGYIYSGKTAGLVAARLQVPETVVVLATNHSGMGKDLSVLTEDNYATPLGELPLAETLADTILKGGVFKADYSAHRNEHSLEVVLPFLQGRRDVFSLLPVVVARISLDELARSAKELTSAIQQVEGKKNRVLIVASTDMSHYVPEEVAQSLDRMAINHILSLDGPGLIKTVQENNITMCGVFPTALLLETAKLLGSTEAELIHYTTSAEASGNTSQVVGYAGIVIP